MRIMETMGLIGILAVVLLLVNSVDAQSTGGTSYTGTVSNVRTDPNTGAVTSFDLTVPAGSAVPPGVKLHFISSAVAGFPKQFLQLKDPKNKTIRVNGVYRFPGSTTGTEKWLTGTSKDIVVPPKPVPTPDSAAASGGAGI